MLMFLGIILKNCAFFSDSELMELLQQDHAPKLAIQLKNLSSQKLLFIPLKWVMPGSLSLPNIVYVD